MTVTLTTDKQIAAECNQIRRYLDDRTKHYTDSQIMELLHIKEKTYYRRKARITEEDINLWNLKRLEAKEVLALRIYDAMDKLDQVCAEIRDDVSAEPKDRYNAGQLCIKARVFEWHLQHTGTPEGLDQINEQFNNLESRRMVQRR